MRSAVRRPSASLFAALLLLAPAAATAEDWSGRVTVYGWFTALDVEATVTGPRGGTATGRGSADIGEVFDALNFALFANGEVRRGRWGLVGDVVYADLNFNRTSPRGVRRDLDLNSFLGTALVAWRAYEDERASVDLMGGGRAVSMETVVSRAGPLVSKRLSATETWVDPLIGVRGRYAIGGFGVGSEFSWELTAGVSHDLTERLSAEAAFRALSIDYDAGAVDQTIEMYGPVLGLSVRF
jgi:opacity protein-like surface antigen